MLHGRPFEHIRVGSTSGVFSRTQWAFVFSSLGIRLSNGYKGTDLLVLWTLVKWVRGRRRVVGLFLLCDESVLVMFHIHRTWRHPLWRPGKLDRRLAVDLLRANFVLDSFLVQYLCGLVGCRQLTEESVCLFHRTQTWLKPPRCKILQPSQSILSHRLLSAVSIYCG